MIQIDIEEAEFIKLLTRTEQLYEHAQEISSAAHKKNTFSVAIFGSARLQKSSEFDFIAELAEAIVKATHADIVTGGGPGLMEAANIGVMHALGNQWDALIKDKKPRSYGLRVDLPFEKEGNPYLHVDKFHKLFTTRLQSFVSLIQGAYISAGGIGTLLELSLLWQLKQAEHLPADFPLVVSPVWQPVIDSFLNITLYQRKKTTPLIDGTDIDLLHFSDDIEEIVDIFLQAKDTWGN
uniref:Uncharacterized protein n=1 Tax=Candidatus Kentrum sp. LFY TaxID=2126342 RepID=A0A450UE23_9GAMM|nr:MAG: hypothetical protein BECKLFY1418B_GA0070995_102134 [Candidatus Kentron sp. LFY]